MRAAVFQNFRGPISVQEIEDPIPKLDGVVVKVTASGLCRSDWHGWMGHDTDINLPHVPGHEFAGTIAAIGSNVKGFKIGDRVTVPFVSGCGKCVYCSEGNHQVCNHQSQPGFTHFGSFAEYVAIDYAQTNLVKLPDEIDDITAALLGCRFITSFRAVVEQGKLLQGQKIAIHGSGGVGLSAIMIAKALGAIVVAVDINDEALQLAKTIGADFLVNAKTSANIAKHIVDLTHGGVHVSLDALGSYQTCMNSINSLRKRGKHIQVGLMTEDHVHPNVPMDKVIANELEIIGSHGMQAYKYPQMLQMIVDGKLQPNLLIEKTITLEESTVILPTMNDFKHRGVMVINSF